MNKNLIYISPQTKITDIIQNNPSILIILEHFGICYEFNNKSLEEICDKYKLDVILVSTIINLFNGHTSKQIVGYNKENVKSIIGFLQSNHNYYSFEKIPKLKALINQMIQVNDHPKINLVNKFFESYYAEVIEHFDYENDTVFPYALGLLNKTKSGFTDEIEKTGFSIKVFKENHEDIEEKLNDLINLLLKYLPVKNDLKVRRELLLGIFELEQNLSVHRLIEDTILVPMLEEAEKRLKDE
ncbi:MAG TPA: hemerythrin domain-containing protein [Melioribacteraceae bacterium]|nr:hemerythrin domain-containing protein [Melioribacteraceae bacterium]